MLSELQEFQLAELQLSTEKMDKLNQLIRDNNDKLHKFADRKEKDGLSADETLEVQKITSETKKLLAEYEEEINNGYARGFKLLLGLMRKERNNE